MSQETKRMDKVEKSRKKREAEKAKQDARAAARVAAKN